LAALAVMVAGEASGAERLRRQISDIPGMPTGMTDVGQDTTGYLWISSGEGLSRYDGFEVRHWGPDPGRLRYVSTGPRGQVLSGSERNGLFEVDGATLRRLDAPEGASNRGPDDASYDQAGRLWAVWDGRLLRRENGTWVEIGGPEIVEDHAFKLAPRDEGGVLLGSRTGDVWIIEGDDVPRRIAQDLGGWIMQLYDDPRGPVATVRFGDRPGLVRITDAGIEYLLDWSSRADGLARRGSSYWIAYPTGVWAVHDDGTREFLSAKEGFAGLGTISTDRDGGLWMANVQGLFHYPQPDTKVWTEISGLPRVYLRKIHPVSDGYLVTSWRGPMHLDPDGSNAKDLDLGGLFSRDAACADPWGGVWMKAFPRPRSMLELENRRPEEAMLVEWRDGRVTVHERGGWYGGDLACSDGPGGSIWIMANGEVLEVSTPGEVPRLRARLPEFVSESLWQAGLAVRRDGSSVVAAFQGGEVCEAALPAGDAVVAEDAWTCETVAEADTIVDLVETDSGRLWLAAGGGGIFEQAETGWRRVSGALSELREALALEPSPSGGLWVIGWRERWRVEESAAGGPPVVAERLGTAQGVPAWQNGPGLLEEADGTIWIPLYSGLVRVPAEARRQIVAAPSVTLTSLVADGRQVAPTEPLELRHGDHSLEMRWSALSFRDPTQVRYRMRLDTNPEWSVLNQPFVRLAGLASGSHRVELGASLDGHIWSDRPAVVQFEVRRAWYMQPWFVFLVNVAVLAALYFGYRVRLAQAIRLERQRTRIAMDLHDEIGAGLGAAGLLAGLLGEGDLGDEERRRIGGRATQQIKDLGGSLADIVWSLRPGTETLAALVLFLRQRASDLFPAGGGTRVNVDAPDPCPELPLDLALRRNLQWIAVEALHNAARHSGARQVVVRMASNGRDSWTLSVRDDGKGFSQETVETDGQVGGLGQESMRRRATEIGADLSVRSVPAEGTEVSIRFRTGRRKS